MRRATPILLAVFALAVGCGESEKDKFVGDYKPLNDKLLAIGRDLGSTVGNAENISDAQLETRFGRLARRLDEVRREIAALDTPADLKNESKGLTSRLGAAVSSLKRIATAAADGDAEASAAATARLAAVSEEINRAQNKLARATGAAVGER